MSTAGPKSTVEAEIAELEERLRLAELGPDPKFFEEVPDDDVVLGSEEGQPLQSGKSWALTNRERGQSSHVLR